ncbi:PE domain-containing protein [Mycobacterium tuberculosis]|uniref:PE domain-containing protein n=1 Tax=Mycobacterium tuberculosis TaxID=1773 RepID=UPI00254B098D|nr:PE domain-containing protein [Mycobacterium tuberculosis]
MSNLLVTPELVAAAAADLAGIGSAIGAANAAANSAIVGAPAPTRHRTKGRPSMAAACPA